MHSMRVFLLTFIVSIHLNAELLIVKQVEDGFEPLTQEESYRTNDAISAILLKYQWPMVISSELTEEEREMLLVSGKPMAEERFIEGKIRALGGEYENYRVAFIPTTIYELFVILQVIRAIKIKDADKLAALEPMIRLGVCREMIDLLNGHDTALEVRKSIAAIYNRINGIFFETGVFAHCCINSDLSQCVFDELCGINRVANIDVFSDSLKFGISALSKKLIFELIDLYALFTEDEKDGQYFCFSYINAMLGQFENRSKSNIIDGNIIEQIIEIEYQARSLNKGLLFRGTSYTDFMIGFGSRSKTALLAGSTLLSKIEWDYENNKPIVLSIDKIYKENRKRLYSVSFGNSLFAGFFRDRSACVCHYLVGLKRELQQEIGYSIFIDKKAYCLNQINDLFFISNLANLAGLFARGEFFHSRAKTPFLRNSDSASIGYILSLIVNRSFLDSTGILTVNRDPLYHAELFSRYLSENARVIQYGISAETEDEKNKFEAKILKSQGEAAQFYKIMRNFKSRIDQVFRFRREKKLAANLYNISPVMELDTHLFN